MMPASNTHSPCDLKNPLQKKVYGVASRMGSHGDIIYVVWYTRTLTSHTANASKNCHGNTCIISAIVIVGHCLHAHKAAQTLRVDLPADENSHTVSDITGAGTISKQEVAHSKLHQ